MSAPQYAIMFLEAALRVGSNDVFRSCGSKRRLPMSPGSLSGDCHTSCDLVFFEAVAPCQANSLRCNQAKEAF